MKISFFIATNGKRKENLDIVLDNLNTLQCSYEKEILVCSPIQIENKCIYIKDNINSGPVSAYNHLLNYYTGDLVVILTDSVYPDNLENIPIIFEQETKNKLYKIIGIKHGGCCFIDHRLELSYRPQIIRWPIIDRNTINKLGCIFNSSFKYHYCDSWISLFCYYNNNEIFESDNLNLISLHHTSDCKYDDYDFNILKKLITQKEIYDLHIG